MKQLIIGFVVVVACLLLGGYYYGQDKYKDGYQTGYNEAYSKGYSDGYADKGKIPEVKTETKIVYEKIPYNGNDVQISTPPPTVTVSLNGKKQEVQQKQETADLQVKTETAVNLKLPERKTVVGIGTDGKHLSGMIKVPVKMGTDATGIWVAGTKGKIMGGVSISF